MTDLLHSLFAVGALVGACLFALLVMFVVLFVGGPERFD